ncbi:GTP cyclohydrolase II [Arcobacter sp. YIC-80]|uniref:GTP cyclohydrolase II n=1 Tax=unclassified Arcobacter TaxID=2593671 RepID=UPI00384CE1FE
MKITKSNIAKLPSKHGKFLIKAYKQDNQEHLAIMSENFTELKSPYVRVHSECLTGDALGSLKCDCQNQLDLALNFISKEGGLVIYHRQEGRNIGLLNKINAYALQDMGRNTVEANLELGFAEDERDYSVVKYIFEDLGVESIKLITNNPKKIDYINSIGVEIVQRIPAITKVNKYNENYLNTKKQHFKHLL